MINAVLYAGFVVAWSHTLLTGKRTILYAIAFLLPLVQALPTPIPTISTPINLMLLGLTGSVFFYPQESRPRAQTLPLKKTILLLVVVLCIGLAIRGMGELLGGEYLLDFTSATKNTYYWCSVFLIYALICRNQGPRFRRDLAVRLVMLSALMEAGVSVLERAGGTGRGSAHFGEPNLAGAYYAAASAFFLAWFLTTSARMRWLYLAAWFVTLGGLFSTLSRGGMIASALANTLVLLIFYVFVRRRSGTKVLFTLLAVLLLANLSILIPQSVKDRVMFTFGGNAPVADLAEDELDDSTEERLFYVHAAWDLFLEQPLGSGAFTFPQRVYQLKGKAKQSHNVFLQVLVEFGIQGFIAVLIFVFATYGFLWRRFRRATDPFISSLSLGMLGWWTGLVVAHIFLNSFFLLEIIGQFLFMIGCLIALPPSTESGKPWNADAPARRRTNVLSSKGRRAVIADPNRLVLLHVAPTGPGDGPRRIRVPTASSTVLNSTDIDCR